MPIVAIPDGEDIARYKEVVSATLADTCTIQSQVQASDGAGGFTHTWSATATVNCRVSIAGERQVSVIAGILQERIPWAFVMLAGTAVSEEDRILYNGELYDVLAVQGNQTVPIQQTILAVKR